MPITTGQSAPDFSLYNTEKQKITLSEQKGKNVVLLFFPQAFTSVCTAELCNVRDNLALYNKTNARVFGISVDSVFTLARFKEDQGLNFDLLSDFNKETAKAYDVLLENFVLDMRGVSRRAAFVIDTEGIIRYAEVLDKASDLPDFQAIQHSLEQLA